MSKSSHDDNLVENDDFSDNIGEWIEESTNSGLKRERASSTPRSGLKWKAIEDYWEQKRLRDALQDDFSEDD